METSTSDPNSGFSSKTKIFHSLRPPISFPPSPTPFSLPDYVFSLLPHSPPTTSLLIDATTRRCIPLSRLPHLVRTLASNLRRYLHLSKDDVAFILSPNSIHIPLLYLSLLSLGAIVSPSNPLSSTPEVSWQIHLSKPVIAFATSETAASLPSLPKGTILLDSPEFESLLVPCSSSPSHDGLGPVEVFQNDTAAILYSSGTTGRVKGVELTHRNFVAAIAGVHAVREARQSPAVTLCVVPFFHVYGFVLCIREVALGGSVVVAAGKSLDSILGAVEESKVTHLAAAPPLVVGMVKSAAAEKYELRSLEAVLCGGAPVANSVIERFKQRFPNISLLQAYGLTETTAGITRTIGLNESRVAGANGRLVSNCQAKIVDPLTGHNLPPLKPGELWIRGPMVMKGYVGDKEATAATIDSEGWLRTGDICYFNSEGLLFYVDRMKELIKYKGYQVAPAELEDILISHPAILDAAVIPYPDEDAGQVPAAFVVRQPGSTINDSQIMGFVAEQVAPYKKIRRVFYIDSIPKNAPVLKE
ncbi:4-coumarate--CoA ligase-like 9 isoform X2 [Sesamum indicum]|uniref:4-coumarate--CoA ligase-like 9 isoform X2 n=1 Tax=Sesamum indicum TaxID=4182 RepID=A0A8M8UX09_SESIN|nr:4-coumarate--CoA ligase-like 9 isoform X2 [Sesamum indicum]